MTQDRKPGDRAKDKDPAVTDTRDPPAGLPDLGAPGMGADEMPGGAVAGGDGKPDPKDKKADR